MMTADQNTEAERKAFEQDAEALGFSTVRLVNQNPEPWDDYLEHNTGHRWGGWLAHAQADPSDEVVDGNTELLDFVEQLTGWHTAKVSNLRKVQENTKAGTLLKLGDDDQEPKRMTKRDAAFFQLGLEAALVELGKLPFTVSHNVDDAEEGEEE